MPAIDPRQIEGMDPALLAALRGQSAKESLRQALAAHELGRRLVEAGVAAQHTGWSADQVRGEVLRRMLGDAGGTAGVRVPNP